MGLIVVGVDGSESSVEALRHALQQAKQDGSTVRVVTAWHVPGFAYGGVGASPLVDVRTQFEKDAKAIQRQCIQDAGEAAKGVQIDSAILEGRTASVLLEEASNADLLVVGSRGHGGFSGLLLGSVSQECAQHSPCPIVIVH